MKNKKEKGAVDSLIFTLVSVIALFVMLYALIPNIKLMQTKSQVNQIAREYILILETRGCLTTQEISDFKTSMEAIPGITVGNMTGTSTAEVAYGDPVTLCFKYTYKMENISVTNLFSPDKTYQDLNFSYSKTSISKK